MGITIEVRNNNVEKAISAIKREKKKENIRRYKKEQKIKALKGEL